MSDPRPPHPIHGRIDRERELAEKRVQERLLRRLYAPLVERKTPPSDQPKTP